LIKNNFLFLFIFQILLFNPILSQTIFHKSKNSLNSQILKEGNLIFRLGKGLWSPLFATLDTKTGFSHVGVLIKKNNEFYVIHSDADDFDLKGGVQITKLEIFIEESRKFEIVKNSMPKQNKKKFINYLLKTLQNKIPFDDQFELSDNGEKMYCTELIWLASKYSGVELGYPMNFVGKQIVTVDSIYNNPVLIKHE
jgi:hypothetical protein